MPTENPLIAAMTNSVDYILAYWRENSVVKTSLTGIYLSTELEAGELAALALSDEHRQEGLFGGYTVKDKSGSVSFVWRDA